MTDYYSLNRGEGISLTALAYYAAFALYCIRATLARTTFTEFMFLDVETFDMIAQVVICILIFVSLFDARYRLSIWLSLLVLVLLSFYVWIGTGEALLFWAFLFIAGGRHRSMKSLALISLGVAILFLILCPIFSASGLIENIWMPGNDERTQRFALGFNHPNTLGYELLIFSSSVSVVRFGKKKPNVDIAVIAVCITIAAFIAGSRTTAFCMVAQALMVLLFYKYGRSSRKLLFGCFCTVLVVVVVSLYLMVCYSETNAIMRAINDLLSNRLVLAHRYYLAHAPELFGYSYAGITIWGYQDFTVDNAYCHLILRSGIVLSVAILILVLLFYRKCIAERYSGVVLFGITLFLVYGFTEVAAFRIEANYFLVALASVLGGGRIAEYSSDCLSSEVRK